MNPSRPELFRTIENTLFDVCIIGGGATGAGAALDAASRGYKALLIERDDFGAATSGKSTKLIHGGVRYLEQAVKKLSIGQYSMVRKALKERKILLKIAPHLTRQLPIITPCHNLFESIYYLFGLKLYDFLSGGSKIGRSQLLSTSSAVRYIPTLKQEHLYAAVLYYDGQLDDQRFNWALVETALEHGACCINHTAAVKFEKDHEGKITALQMADMLSGNSVVVKSKCFINATGPYADHIRNMANDAAEKRIRVSKGVHILLPGATMPGNAAMLIPKTKDGRLIFAIPYQQQLLVGTTDEETELTKETFGPDEAEVNYLIEYLRAYLSVPLAKEQVQAGFGGLRPLVKKVGEHTRDLVRDHEVERDATSGLISILGGKWTTYRLMAKDGIDAAEELLGEHRTCRTQEILLAGSRNFGPHMVSQLKQQCAWENDIIDHLVNKYGDKALQIAAIADASAAFNARLHPDAPYTFAELQYVIQHEMASTVKDVVCQRWGIELLNWHLALIMIPLVGKFMKQYFSWNDRQEKEFIWDYQQEVQNMVHRAMSSR